MASNAAWNGIKQFSRQFEAEVVDSTAEIDSEPPKTALIVIPYMTYEERELAAIKSFLEEGGELVLMDDFGYGNSVLEYLGIRCRFSGAPLLDPLFSYRRPWFPKISDFAAGITRNRNAVRLVVLNHATALENVTPDEILAWSSHTAYLDLNGNEAYDEGEPESLLPVAAVTRYGRGTVVLVADPSIIINTMVLRDDNDAFMKAVLGLGGDRAVAVDTSHLARDPVDVSKAGLARVYDILTMPYWLLGLVALIFAVVAGSTLSRGGSGS
jgi:hypothetical protein